MGFTRTVLWHRFFHQQARGPEKLWTVLCYFYRNLFQCSTDLARCLLGQRSFAAVKAYIEGVFVGLKWIRTKEYKDLPPLV